nr:MAG TPA: hypothetical protein [Caudoviricetes sp.]
MLFQIISDFLTSTIHIWHKRPSFLQKVRK